MDKLALALGTAVLAVLIIFFCAFVYAIPTWLLWNWLMPIVFALPKLTLFQAWGMTFLTGILFKSVATSKS